MSQPERWAANAVILGVVGLSAACFLVDREIWPFSRFPMYSIVPGRSEPFERLQLVGRTGKAEWDLAVQTDSATRRYAYIRPFDWSRLRRALNSIESSPDAAGRRREALGDILRRYEERRAAGLHDGPRLESIHLYRSRWLDAGQPLSDARRQRTLLGSYPPERQ